MPRDVALAAEAAQLISILRRRGWKIYEIAYYPDIEASPSAVSKWSCGQTSPGVHVIDALRVMVNDVESPQKGRDRQAKAFVADVMVLRQRGWSINLIAKRIDVHRRIIQRALNGVRPRQVRILHERVKRLLQEPSPRTVREVILGVMCKMAEQDIYDQGYQALADYSGYSLSVVRRSVNEMILAGDVSRLNSEPSQPNRFYVHLRPGTVTEESRFVRVR